MSGIDELLPLINKWIVADRENQKPFYDERLIGMIDHIYPDTYSVFLNPYHGVILARKLL